MNLSSRLHRALSLLALTSMLAGCSGLETSLPAESLPAKTALDAYVAAPDSSYSWKVVAEQEQDGLRGVVIEMVSQTWRKPEEVNRTVWKHELKMVIPEKRLSDRAMLFISGGSNRGRPPGPPSRRLAGLAQASQAIVVELRMIPNQPLSFGEGDRERYEDDLIAHTWNRYLDTGDPTWVARMPMVKACVRAMDTIQAFLKSEEGGEIEVEEFVVAGASKRGWTTWLTGAVDTRVIAIIPIVIDVLNMVPSMEHHFAAYGFWAPAVGDYERNGIMDRRFDPRYDALVRLVDPYYYRHRLTMPKFILNASGDQFFLPDSSKFYYDQLKGEKHLRYVPNADHGLDNSDASESLQAYFQAVITDTARPEYSWRFTDDGGIEVRPETPPAAVRLWQATNPEARDFRLDVVGPIWKSTDLRAREDGSFHATVPEPEKGWTAFFVELEYSSGGPNPFKFTSGVRVVPDVLPHLDKLEALNQEAGS